jgi:hypothetical protein
MFLVYTSHEKLQFVVCWVVASCGVVVVYKSFGGPCCFQLQEGKFSHQKVTFLDLVSSQHPNVLLH